MEGPPPWDDEYVAWQCTNSMVYNFCEYWTKTTDGWECTNPAGLLASHCIEWEKNGDDWKCTDGSNMPGLVECEYWEETAKGWKCTDSTTSNYCERWEKTPDGWDCTNGGHSGHYCEAWEKTTEGWKCTNGGHLEQECREWHGIRFGWPEGVSVEFQSCTCKSDGVSRTLTASASTEPKAEYQCGSACGGLSDCGKKGESCRSCCSYYCNNAGLSGSNAIEGCTTSCEVACGGSNFVNELTRMFIMLSVAIAVLIFAACGLKFLVSDSPADRDSAKKCLIYVIIALTLLGSSGYIVGMFYGQDEATPGPGIGVPKISISKIQSSMSCPAKITLSNLRKTEVCPTV